MNSEDEFEDYGEYDDEKHGEEHNSDGEEQGENYVDRERITTGVSAHIDTKMTSSKSINKRQLFTPRDNFFLNLKKLYNNLKQTEMNHSMYPTDLVFTEIVDLADTVEKLEYKNAVCFVFGYMLVSNNNSDKNIEKAINEYMQFITNELNIVGIEKPDLVRYKRFIENMRI